MLAGGALAGTPLHREQECHMQGHMQDMADCCVVAELQGDAPQVLAARLCCAMNCTMPGTTAPNAALKLPPFNALTPHVVLPPPLASALASASPHRHLPPARLSHAPPAYIRHLALLI